MLRKRIFAFILTMILLTGATSALAAEAGSQSDPLVSLSYAKTWAQTVSDSAVSKISTTLNPFYQVASKNAVASLEAGVGSSVFTLAAGGTVDIATGSSVTLVSGAATIAIGSGAIVNVSVGAAAGNGKLNRYQNYIACENTSAKITVSETALFIVDGSFTKTDPPTVFTDVKSADWFYSDVYNAVDKGLINGMTATTYVPTGTLTAAQAVKLAACMHQLYYEGEVTLKNGDPWYRSYADYALESGIISQDFSDYDAIITRQQFIVVFYNALPAEEYQAINEIQDGAIPDVSITDQSAAEIYTFYRAGILTGYTNTSGFADYAFGADTTIARSEVAAILTRMFDDSARKTFTLS
ncbi:MAG: S-layer homology domain-containing protein [Clostridia bacterium]|nr:S-layer homology domain-containing protein [Clostridia bacterium]